MGQSIRRRIHQWTGLAVCVGIGSTKTLAKLANHIARKIPYSMACAISPRSCKRDEIS
jgi:DNA polymerase V